MIWLARRLKHDFPTWERSAQTAFILALALLALAIGLGLWGPDEARLGALAGAVGLLVVLQLTVLWANRGMVTDLTQAQRLYLAEDFDAVRSLLEALRDQKKADMRALTLLGNTYRQLGRLEDSHRELYEALNKAPNHHFPMYGFGRTLLSEGNYAEAAETLRRSLELGAPTAVAVDLAEALYRAGQNAEAVEALQKVGTLALEQEPHRLLMAQYLLYRLGAGNRPANEVVSLGLPYWMAAAARFQQTQYGADLTQDIRHMHGRTE
jgi:tetratricopeptide (TPR) repeat protein